MAIKTREYTTLLVILIVMALISFTVQAVLESDTDFQELGLAPVTGQVTAHQDEPKGMNKILTDIADWIMES